MFPDERGVSINIWGISDPKSGYTSDKDRARSKKVNGLHDKSDKQQKIQKKLEMLGDKILPSSCFKNWIKKTLYFIAAVYDRKSTNTSRSIHSWSSPVTTYDPFYDCNRARLLTKAGKANKIIKKCTRYFSGKKLFLLGYGPNPEEVKNLNKNISHGEVAIKGVWDERVFWKQVNEQDDAANMIINTLKTLHKYKLPNSIAPRTMSRCLEKMRKYCLPRCRDLAEIEELYSKLT